jgi:signal transduction histidine kinase
MAVDSAEKPTAPRFMGPGIVVALVMVVVASLLRTFTRAYDAVGPERGAATAALSAAYVLVGAVGLYRAEHRGNRRGLLAYLYTLIVLALLVVPLSNGEAWFMVLPVVTLSVLFLSPARGTGVIALMAAAVVAGEAVFAGGPARHVVQELVTHASAFAFVVVFSRMALQQHQARSRIEQLVGELGEANERLREHAAQAHDLATTKERNRIAREIHDGLGHYLTVVFVQLEAAEKLFAKDPARALQAIAKARKLTHEGLDEVRRAVSVLRGSAPAGRTLLQSLEALANAATEGGVDTRLVVHGDPRPLAEPTEFTLYRAAQEALTNVSRHARAKNVKLELEFVEPESVALRVEDDGIGSDRAEGGFGLVGLRERAELVGGKLTIKTARAKGFAIELRVPG